MASCIFCLTVDITSGIPDMRIKYPTHTLASFEHLWSPEISLVIKLTQIIKKNETITQNCLMLNPVNSRIYFIFLCQSVCGILWWSTYILWDISTSNITYL